MATHVSWCQWLHISPWSRWLSSHLCWRGTWKWTVYILQVTDLPHCRSDWDVSTSGKGYVMKTCFVEQPSVTLSGTATSLRCWISHCHTSWAALERQEIWQDPRGVEGGAMRSLPAAKVCSQTAAAVLQSPLCLLPGKQCPVPPGQNSAAADS